MIHLPEVCHEGWNNMTPVNGGRHCHSCNKVLPDFSGMTTDEIEKHIRTTGAECGRFRADQVTDGSSYGNWKFYGKWKTAVALLMIGSLFMVSCRRHVKGKMNAYPSNDARSDKAKTEQKR